MGGPGGFGDHDALRFLRSLRSVRRYSPRPVPADVVLQVLEVARWTGSGKNLQPWHFVVVRDAHTRRQLSMLGPFASHVADAPVVVAIAMAGDPFASDFDEGRVAHAIALAAAAVSLGSCIVFLEPPENRDAARSLLLMPATHRLRTLVTLGYVEDGSSTYDPLCGPSRQEVLGTLGRAPLTELISYERFGQ